MWNKASFNRAIKAKLTEIEARKAEENNPHAVYHNEKEYVGALLWLSGKTVPIDFKVESRQRDGVWRHVLMNGVMGYTAASPLVEIVDG